MFELSGSLPIQLLAAIAMLFAIQFLVLKSTWRNIVKLTVEDVEIEEPAEDRAYSETEKKHLKSNDKFCSTISDPMIKLVAQDLYSNNISQQMEAVILLRKLYSRTDKAPSIRQVAKLKIVPKLVELLETSTLPRIKSEVIWIMCNVNIFYLII
jgi:hypothetical protein